MTARDKDQFYTKPEVAEYCYEKFKDVANNLGVDLSQYLFVEPAAGSGHFYDLMPKDNRVGIDIEAKNSDIVQCDYLKWRPYNRGKCVVVGNPPFGVRGTLALNFINHSAFFADMVAFILPPLFDSDGKGVPSKRVKVFTCAHTERLMPDSFQYPDGRDVTVHTIFQVWTKIGVSKIRREIPKTCKQFIGVYSLTDGGTPSTTRNKDMIGKCDLYIPSTTYKAEDMQVYSCFEDLPHNRGYGIKILRRNHDIEKIFCQCDLGRLAFRSTNGSYNLRTSLIESVVTEAGLFDD